MLHREVRHGHRGNVKTWCCPLNNFALWATPLMTSDRLNGFSKSHIQLSPKRVADSCWQGEYKEYTVVVVPNGKQIVPAEGIFTELGSYLPSWGLPIDVTEVCGQQHCQRSRGQKPNCSRANGGKMSGPAIKQQSLCGHLGRHYPYHQKGSEGGKGFLSSLDTVLLLRAFARTSPSYTKDDRIYPTTETVSVYRIFKVYVLCVDIWWLTCCAGVGPVAKGSRFESQRLCLYLTKKSISCLDSSIMYVNVSKESNQKNHCRLLTIA